MPSVLPEDVEINMPHLILLDIEESQLIGFGVPEGTFSETAFGVEERLRSGDGG
jgi:hypothetical protein